MHGRLFLWASPCYFFSFIHLFSSFIFFFFFLSFTLSLTLYLQPLSFSSRKQSNTQMHPHPIFFRSLHKIDKTESFIFFFASFTLPHQVSQSHTNVHVHIYTCTLFTFSKQDSIKFVFISSLQTGLNLSRRNNIPACCVKLYELMKSTD